MGSEEDAREPSLELISEHIHSYDPQKCEAFSTLSFPDRSRVTLYRIHLTSTWQVVTDLGQTINWLSQRIPQLAEDLQFQKHVRDLMQRFDLQLVGTSFYGTVGAVEWVKDATLISRMECLCLEAANYVFVRSLRDT